MNKHEEIKQVFFQDPRWQQVEDLIMEYINPLMDMTTVDTTQPAEAVKAEIIGRTIAYNKLKAFVEQSHLVGSPKREINNVFK